MGVFKFMVMGYMQASFPLNCAPNDQGFIFGRTGKRGVLARAESKEESENIKILSGLYEFKCLTLTRRSDLAYKKSRLKGVFNILIFQKAVVF